MQALSFALPMPPLEPTRDAVVILVQHAVARQSRQHVVVRRSPAADVPPSRRADATPVRVAGVPFDALDYAFLTGNKEAMELLWEEAKKLAP